MSLAPGARIGPYEVTAQIGAGGMGEVYRATDTNLKRQVAIKVLPDAVASDADRLARFRREAEVLATLNHPNIAHVYGLEKADGATALVMELVEGDDLSTIITRGPVSLSDSLSIARQIADALEAAHEHGIIHRDLKPANVKVRADGTVKVLDFGLAKAFESPGAASASASMSPTITTPAMTEMGMILGTAAYMAPEQARGKVVDKRADIWAFGCVLYEMLTGRRAFEGEDVSLTLAAVLRADVMFDALPVETPPRVRRVLVACLQRDLKQRAHDIGDVRLALEGAFETTTASAAAPVAVEPAWRRPVPLSASVAVLTLALAAVAVWWVRPAPQPRPLGRFAHVLPKGQALRNAARQVLALSRDGSRFVYNADGGLYLRSMEALDASLVLGTERALANPFFSPDGQWVGYFQTGQLKRIATSGGAPVVICPATNPLGVSWEADNTILFSQPEGILRVSADGGTPSIVIPAKTGERFYGPELLPGGKALLFTLAKSASGWDDAEIVAQSLETGERTVLVRGGRDAHYVATGHLVYSLQGGVFAVSCDVDHLRITSGPVSVLQGVDGSANGATAAAFYAVSDSGTLIYVSTEQSEVPRQLTWFDRKGTVLGTLGEADPSLSAPELSPDGRRAAVSRTVAGQQDVWIVDALRTTRLTFGSKLSRSRYPLWSPDGTRVAYLRTADRSDEYVKRADGGGAEEPLVQSPPPVPSFNGVTSWSRAGFILVDKSPVDIWVIPTGGDRKPFPFIDGTPSEERLARFSPDGRWVAYQSSESGQRAEIFVRPFPGPGGRWQVSTAGGAQPRWRADGRELYWIAPDAKLMAASIAASGDTANPGTPMALFQTQIFLGGTEQPDRGQYDVAPDGRFLINALADTGGAVRLQQITIVQNWVEELKRLAPAK